MTPIRPNAANSEAYLAILSHELRTPITTIYAGSRVLAGREPVGLESSRDLALDISAEAARLYDTVEDLLVVARLERDAVRPATEPVLLQRVADSVVWLMAARDPTVPIRRTGDGQVPAVAGDRTLVEHAVRNLVATVMRCAAPARPIHVRIDLEDAAVALRVLDLGLRPSAPFPRLADSGLGLFVARQLIETMAGRTWIATRSDGVTEVGLSLPIYVDTAS